MRSFHLITILLAEVCIVRGFVLYNEPNTDVEAHEEENRHPGTEQRKSVNPYLNGDFVIAENKNVHYKMVKVYEENPVFTFNNFGDEDEEVNIGIRNGEGLKISYPKGEIFVPTKRKKIHIKTIDIFDENTADSEYGGPYNYQKGALQNYQSNDAFQNQQRNSRPEKRFSDRQNQITDIISIPNIFAALKRMFENIWRYILSFFPCLVRI